MSALSQLQCLFSLSTPLSYLTCVQPLWCYCLSLSQPFCHLTQKTKLPPILAYHTDEKNWPPKRQPVRWPLFCPLLSCPLSLHRSCLLYHSFCCVSQPACKHSRASQPTCLSKGLDSWLPSRLSLSLTTHLHTLSSLSLSLSLCDILAFSFSSFYTSYSFHLPSPHNPLRCFRAYLAKGIPVIVHMILALF